MRGVWGLRLRHWGGIRLAFAFGSRLVSSWVVSVEVAVAGVLTWGASFLFLCRVIAVAFRFQRGDVAVIR